MMKAQLIYVSCIALTQAYGYHQQPTTVNKEIIHSNHDYDHEPICPSGGSPVCATNGYEYYYFENECRLDAYNYKLLFSGKIELTKTYIGNCFSSCDAIKCPYVLRPVCAKEADSSYGRTLPNECEVNRQICLTRKQWYIVNRGPCDHDVTCPQSCPNDYKPLCAVFNNAPISFPNECELKRLICQTKNAWQILNHGPCKIPPAVCSTEFVPVCASLNGTQKTFSNLCLLNAEIAKSGNVWKVIKYESCPSDHPASSADTYSPKCPAGDFPVCASVFNYNHTFESTCAVEKANASGYLKWTIISHGACDATPTTSTHDSDTYSDNSYSNVTNYSSSTHVPDTYSIKYDGDPSDKYNETAYSASSTVAYDQKY